MRSVLRTATAMPLTLMRALAGLFGSTKSHDPSSTGPARIFTDAEVESQIRIAPARTDLNMSLIKRNAERIDALLEELDMMGIRDAFAEWDASRAVTTDGFDYVTSAMQHLRSRLALWIHPPKGALICETFEVDPAILDAFEDLCAEHPDDHILAALTAALHVDAGWAARGDGPSKSLSDKTIDMMTAHFEAARKVVTRFDPVAYDSPLLAEVQYRMCPGLENGGDRLSDAFIDWLDLTPMMPHPYRNHGVFLLPQWFGSYELLEETADALAAANQDVWGNAAYALTYLDALRADEGAMEQVDISRFMAGTSDWLSASGNNPCHVIETLRFLDQICLRRPQSKRLAPLIVAKQASIRMGMRELMTEHLRGFADGKCQVEKTELLHVIASAFEDEIKAGALISFNHHGLEIIADVMSDELLKVAA